MTTQCNMVDLPLLFIWKMLPLVFNWKIHLIIREKPHLCKIERYYSIRGIAQTAKHFHIHNWFPQITLHSGRERATWILFRLLSLCYTWEQWCWERWGDFLLQCSFSILQLSFSCTAWVNIQYHENEDCVPSPMSQLPYFSEVRDSAIHSEESWPPSTDRFIYEALCKVCFKYESTFVWDFLPA